MINSSFYVNEARCPQCGQWMIINFPSERFTPCRRCLPEGNLGFVTDYIVLAKDEDPDV